MKMVHALMCTIILILIYEEVDCSVDNGLRKVGDFFVRSWQSLVNFITVDEKLHRPLVKRRRRKRSSTIISYTSSKFIRILPATTSMRPSTTTTTEPIEHKIQGREVPYMYPDAIDDSMDDWVKTENMHNDEKNNVLPFVMRRWGFEEDIKSPSPYATTRTTNETPRPSNPEPRRMLIIPHLKTRPDWNIDEWKSEYGPRSAYDRIREILLRDRPADFYL